MRHYVDVALSQLAKALLPFTIAIVLLAIGCGETETVEEPDPGDLPANVNSYMADLGSWADYAPPEESKNEAVPGVLTTSVEEAVGDVTYVCEETPFSLTATPAEIVMYDPNASIMWVGNLIQGASYKGGTGSFQVLSIRQRRPLRISIDLLTGDNYAEVENPSLSTVQSAIGDLIQQASDAGHRSGSSIDFTSRLTYSVEQAALSLGLSAHYLGASATTELSLE